MLAQVVEHARPFVRVESSVQPFDAQLPRRSRAGGRGDQIARGCDDAVSFQQTAQFGQSPRPSTQASASQPGLPAGEIQ